MRSFAASLIVTIVTGGCATSAAKNVPATGAPLQVDVREEVYTYTASEQVGQVEHRDASGALVGTSTVTQDVQRTGVARSVTLLQGHEPLDEQDFYAIAGDQDAKQQIEGERRMGEWLQIGGLTTVGLGGAAVAVGMLPTYLGTTSDAGAIGVVAGSTLMTGGLLVACAGGLAYFYGNGLLEPGRMVKDEAHAMRTADAYNARVAAAKDVVDTAAPAAVDTAAVEPAAVAEPDDEPAAKPVKKAKKKKRG